MPGTNYVVKFVAGNPVVVTPQEVDIGDAAELRAALLRAAAKGRDAITVDMSVTEFCDSAGLAVLVRARRLAIAEGRELQLIVSTPQVTRILAVTGLDRWFPCFRSQAEAMSGRPGSPDVESRTP